MARLNTDPSSGAVKPSAPVPSRGAAKPASTFNPRSGQPFDAILAQAAAQGQAQYQVHAAGPPKPPQAAGLPSPIRQLFGSALPAREAPQEAESAEQEVGEGSAGFDWDQPSEGPSFGSPGQSDEDGAAWLGVQAQGPGQGDLMQPRAQRPARLLCSWPIRQGRSCRMWLALAPQEQD